MKEVGRDREVQELVRGNTRFAGGWPTHPHQARERRLETVTGQRPFAAILSCSDSRVPPEIVFDQGLGDLFVVRTAGHLLDETVLGSLEYAVLHLKVPLVVVLGHTGCGAVAAAIAGGEGRGHLGRLVEAIRPAVEACDAKGSELLEEAVKEHVLRVAAEIEGTLPVLAPLVRDETLSVVGAIYRLDTGRVEFLK